MSEVSKSSVIGVDNGIAHAEYSKALPDSTIKSPLVSETYIRLCVTAASVPVDVSVKSISDGEPATLSAVKETVNGKIDAMHNQLKDHTRIDEETNQKLIDYIREDTDWKKTADPYIKLAVNIAGTWKFAIYVLTGLLVVIGFYKIFPKQVDRKI